jgi:hypothetical protein
MVSSRFLFSNHWQCTSRGRRVYFPISHSIRKKIKRALHTSTTGNWWSLALTISRIDNLPNWGSVAGRSSIFSLTRVSGRSSVACKRMLSTILTDLFLLSLEQSRITAIYHHFICFQGVSICLSCFVIRCLSSHCSGRCWVERLP